MNFKIQKSEISENWICHCSLVLLLLLTPSSVVLLFFVSSCSSLYYIILMDPFTKRRIYDSNDENWTENRKNCLHDPLNVRKDSNKDIPESSKSKVEKIHTHKKKREKYQQSLLPGRHCFWYVFFILLLKLFLNL